MRGDYDRLNRYLDGFDDRLVAGFLATGDPVVDDTSVEVGLGRRQVMSREGRLDAAARWEAEFGPDTAMALHAPSTCDRCGFYLPLAGSLSAAFGVCGNEFGTDGHVVAAAYGCGAHSDTELPKTNRAAMLDPYDDAAIEVVEAAPREPVAEVGPAPAEV
jgi:hypothetical protein